MGGETRLVSKLGLRTPKYDTESGEWKFPFDSRLQQSYSIDEVKDFFTPVDINPVVSALLDVEFQKRVNCPLKGTDPEFRDGRVVPVKVTRTPSSSAGDDGEEVVVTRTFLGFVNYTDSVFSRLCRVWGRLGGRVIRDLIEKVDAAAVELNVTIWTDKFDVVDDLLSRDQLSSTDADTWKQWANQFRVMETADAAAAELSVTSWTDKFGVVDDLVIKGTLSRVDADTWKRWAKGSMNGSMNGLKTMMEMRTIYSNGLWYDNSLLNEGDGMSISAVIDFVEGRN